MGLAIEQGMASVKEREQCCARVVTQGVPQALDREVEVGGDHGAVEVTGSVPDAYASLHGPQQCPCRVRRTVVFDCAITMAHQHLARPLDVQKCYARRDRPGG